MFNNVMNVILQKTGFSGGSGVGWGVKGSGWPEDQVCLRTCLSSSVPESLLHILRAQHSHKPVHTLGVHVKYI